MMYIINSYTYTFNSHFEALELLNYSTNLCIIDDNRMKFTNFSLSLLAIFIHVIFISASAKVLEWIQKYPNAFIILGEWNIKNELNLLYHETRCLIRKIVKYLHDLSDSIIMSWNRTQ